MAAAKVCRIARHKGTEPPQQAAEVVSGGGEDGVDGIAGAVGEEVPVHAVVGLAMADDRLDAGAAFELPSDGGGDASLLARGVDPELVFCRGVVAPVSGIGEDAGQAAPVSASMPGRTVLSVCPS